MSAENKPLILNPTNTDGFIPVPQVFDPKKDSWKATLGEDGVPYSISAGSKTTPPITFQSATPTVSDGTLFDVGGYKHLSLSITGTSTSRTIVFEQQDIDGNWFPLVGARDSSADIVVDTQTTGNNEVWQFDITGKKAVRARITAVSGGNVTIKGTAVS